MKISTATLALTTLVLEAQAQSCQPLSTPGNPMLAALKSFVPNVTTLVASFPPTWSSCLGSISPTSFMADIVPAMASQPSCAALPAVLAAPPSNTSTNLWASLNVSVDYCTATVQPVLPCINSVLLPAAVKQLNGNACCSAMVQDFKTAFGDAPDVFLTKLINMASDVICSTQSPGLNGAVSQTCGTAWTQSLTGGDVDASVSTITSRLLTALQVPNNQACAAARGDAFTTTTGQVVSTLFTKPYVPDSCIQPVDTLVSYMRSWPAYKTQGMPQLFENGQCIQGRDITKALGSYSTVYIQLGVTKNQLEGACFHVANGGLGGCAFSTQLTRVAPPMDFSMSATGAKKSNAIASSVTLLALTVVAAILW
ncbi:Aste57867_15875 [Aphanomyces stellatus]|uniref:Aste57867_15875 protein n=1 Tax=Aphanomyces stellatus TaxID=120398 RepID=A0A485L7A6_9STRA|nr:hypothetical protein As57867_015819 [Aphanomyces stellatus]VFT92662.1 Aste57867_15875 [Aphanomyces stellatus]